MTVSVIPNGIKHNLSKKEGCVLIKSIIADQKTFAYTRFGDGEALILQAVQGHPLEVMEFLNLRIQKNWDIPPGQELQQISEPMLAALAGSDLIGVDFKYGIPKNLIPQGQQVIPRMALNHTIDYHNLDDFFQGQDVRIFTSYGQHLQDIVQERAKSSRVKVITIPYLMPLKESQEKLASMTNFPEPLVLWGCGGGMKNLGVHLRDKFKKTCIDVGTMLRTWNHERLGK